MNGKTASVARTTGEGVPPGCCSAGCEAIPGGNAAVFTDNTEEINPPAVSETVDEPKESVA
jgi:hypothetical protein